MDREQLTERILQNQGRLLACMRLPQAQGLLGVELTMPQFKALALLEAHGSATVGQLARGLGVGLSTMTGIVDRLCEHGVVSRGEDPDDRRATRVRLLPAGLETMARFHEIRRGALTRVLAELTDDELRLTADATAVLARAAEAVVDDLSEIEEAPAGAGGVR